MLSERDLLVVRLAELRGHISSETAARVQQSGANLALGIQPAHFEALAAMADDIVARRSRLVAGRFQVLEKLGAGGMGVVYKARDLKLDRTIAIKALGRTEPADLERFAREARMAASLRHPNIVETYDIVADGDETFITMQVVEGMSLGRAAKALDARAVAEAVAQAADGLDFAHRKGLVHRDVKPDNILLDGERKAYLTDFGLAKKIEGGTKLTMSGAAVGTPAYMAPEQARADKAQIGPRSDVYGLGASLYDLLAGRPPFVGDTAFEILLAVIDGDAPPLPRTVPHDLAMITMRAMAPEPAQRYATAGELAADLRRWLRGEPVVARSPSSLARLLRWSKRNARSVTITMTVALALVLTGAGYVAMSKRVGNREEAERLLQRGSELVRDFEQDSIRMGRPAVEARTREGIDLLRKAAEADKTYALPRVWLGRACACLGLRDEARRHYDEAIRIDPASSEAYYWRGNLSLWEYELKREPPRFLVTMDGVEIRPAPDSAEQAELRTKAAGDFEKALELWRSATGTDLPERDHAVGFVAIGKGDYGAALTSIDAMVAKRSYSGMAHYHRALALLYLKRFRDAKEAFAKAASLSDPSPSLAGHEAMCLLLAAEERGDDRAALAAECLAFVRDAQSRWPEYWRFHYIEASALEIATAEANEDLEAGFQKALEAMDRAIARRPDQATLYLAAADLYVDLIRAASREQRPVQKYLNEGLSAIETYLKAAEDEHGYSMRAQLLMEAAQASGLRAGARIDLANRALDDFDQVLRRDRDNVNALLLRGTLRVKMAAWQAPGLDEGLADIDRARSIRPSAAVLAKRASVLIEVARLKRTKSAYEAAIAALGEAMEKRTTADLLVSRAIAKLEAGIEGGREDIDEALKRQPKSPSALTVKAGILVKEGERREIAGGDGRPALLEAITIVEDVVRRLPGFPDARNALALARAELWRASMRRGDPAQNLWSAAVKEFGGLIEVEPDHGSALIGRGNLLGQMAEMTGSADLRTKARDDFEAAMKAAPHKWEAPNGLGMLLRGEAAEKGREDLFDAALAAFAKAVALAPDNAVLLGNLARARLQYAELLEKHGKDPLPQVNASITELSDVLRRMPGFLRAYPWLAESLTARAAVKRAQGGAWEADVEAAIAVLAKAIGLDASFAEAYRTRGVLYLDLGKKAEARKDLLKAIELRPAWKRQLEPLIPRE